MTLKLTRWLQYAVLLYVMVLAVTGCGIRATQPVVFTATPSIQSTNTLTPIAAPPTITPQPTGTVRPTPGIPQAAEVPFREYIAFSHTGYRVHSDVLAVDAHNRQTIPFTPDEIEVWGTIALSPDMKRIAMYCYYPEREPDGTPIAGTGWSGICLQNTDGSGFTRLLEKYDTALYSIGGVLAWSYDGQFIVFQGVPEDEISGRIELYSVDVITGRHQQLTTIDTDIGTNQIRCMSASPDGRWLAMMLNWDIYLLELNTMEFSHFVRGGCPTWLHDGSAMIFAKSTGEGIVRLSLEDKTEQVLVVRNRLWCPSPSGGLALSPDEEQLVFTDACGEEHHDLWLLHIASGDVVPLISSSQLGPQDARFPVWVVIP